jgi:hypothetical protein
MGFREGVGIIQAKKAGRRPSFSKADRKAPSFLGGRRSFPGLPSAQRSAGALHVSDRTGAEKKKGWKNRRRFSRGLWKVYRLSVRPV